LPTIHKRNCDNCHKYYEGRGSKYCSTTCSYEAARLSENIIASSIVPEFNLDLFNVNEEYLYDETESRVRREEIFSYFNDGKRRKINVISDLEFPYHDTRAIYKALTKGRQDGATILSLAGDINHHTICSAFNILKDVPLEQEKQLSRNLIEFARSEGYEHVLAISGNHDRRLQKMLPKVLSKYPGLKTQIRDDMLADIEEEYDGYFIYAKGWWVQVGGCIISHPGRYSSVKENLLVNSKNTVDYFLRRGHEFQAVVQGHSHIMGMGKHCRKAIIETGCMCKQIDYNVSDKQTNPIWEQAHAVIALDGYDFIWNDTRLYEIGTIGTENNVARLRTGEDEGH